MKQDKYFYIKLRAKGQRKRYVRMQKAWAKWQKNVSERWTDNLTSARLAYLTLR